MMGTAKRVGCVLLLVGPGTAASGVGAAATTAVSPLPGGGLEAALKAIQPDKIEADLTFFASDEMRGRDTPSPELEMAARFIESRLEKLGFEPGAGQDFFHEYALEQRKIDPETSELVFEQGSSRAELTFAEDYFLYSTRDFRDLENSGPVIFCGTGQSEELERAELAGAWALCFDSELSASRRRRNVEKTEALGLIVMPAPATGSDPFPEKFRRTTEVALKGVASLPRPSGSERKAVLPQLFLSRAAGLELLSLAAARGETPPESWTPELGAKLARATEKRVAGGRIQVENVCGFWPGSDPELAKEVLIVSAHYDHVGVNNGQIFNGADDNGSGSMGLLAIAEALSNYGPMRRSVMLIWVSGEEKGLWGSAAWTRDPTLPAGTRAVCDINIDMIGRNAPDYLLITPSPARPEYSGLTKLAEELGDLEGFPELGSADDYWARSDHMNFANNLDIPVAFLFSDVHEDYHKPTDTPDKIDYDKIHRVARLVVRMLDRLQADSLTL